MKLIERFAQKPCVFSIEVFPPKKDGAGPETLFPRLAEMARLHPDYISVTYGAGGSAAGKGTCEIAAYLKHTLGVEPLAHLTCVGATEQQTADALAALARQGIENVLALRGDMKPGMPDVPGAFAHASDLAAFVRARGDFCVAGACYPEGHVESASLRADVQDLHYKIDAGTQFLVTQLFFDNGCYYRLLNMARRAGYTLPIEAGVMPIVRASQIQRTVALSSASLPGAFTRMISRWEHDEASLYEAGIDYAVRQLRDLIEGGADGVHLYAMNNAEVARRVYEGICDLLPTADAPGTADDPARASAPQGAQGAASGSAPAAAAAPGAAPCR